jgi:hypothetical protein
LPRSCDADALTPPTAELPRAAAHRIGRKAHLGEQGGGDLGGLLPPWTRTDPVVGGSAPASTRAHNIGEGVCRAPAGAERVRVDLGHVCVSLPPGTSLVALVSGSSFPRSPLPTGESVQTVHPGSHLELTVAPMEQSTSTESG